MFKYLATAAFALVLVNPVQAEETVKGNADALGIAADGTWDCNDAAGTYLGAIVVADLSYAFISPEGAVGTYGKLNKDVWLDAPAFFILNGELKDRFAGLGLSMVGPPDRPEDFVNWDMLRLQVVIAPGNIFYCARRKRPTT